VTPSTNHLLIELNKEQQRAASSGNARDQTASLTCLCVYPKWVDGIEYSQRTVDSASFGVDFPPPYDRWDEHSKYLGMSARTRALSNISVIVCVANIYVYIGRPLLKVARVKNVHFEWRGVLCIQLLQGPHRIPTSAVISKPTAFHWSEVVPSCVVHIVSPLKRFYRKHPKVRGTSQSNRPVATSICRSHFQVGTMSFAPSAATAQSSDYI
jgi:hypothetical protein